MNENTAALVEFTIDVIEDREHMLRRRRGEVSDGQAINRRPRLTQ
jgi:hypothetical protein